MAQNVTLMGANYPDVPAVVLPKTGGGSATFVELTGEDGKVVENGELVSQSAQLVISNGTYDTTKKNQVQVSVANKYTAEDQGKVVQGQRQLVAQTSTTKTANGTYDTTLNNEVVVAVPNTYEQSDEGKVVQNGALVSQGAEMITANGTYDTTTTEEVVVNVPSGGTNKEADIVQGTLSGRYENSQATSVREYAFYKCDGLTEVSFPNATTIGDYAFYEYCTSLERVEIASATNVGNYSFYGATSLEEVVSPSLLTIWSSAFEGCSSLTDVDLSATTKIWGSAFRGCTALTEVIARNCEAVGGSTFRECSSLTDVELPSCLTLESASFRDCVALVSIVLPKAGIISDSSFYGCTNVETIDLGGNYTGTSTRKIGKMVFYNCSSLTALILREPTVYPLNNVSSFTGTPISDGTGYIYVPDALKATYQSATNWQRYSSQFRSLEDYTVDGTTTGALDPTKI